MVPVMTVPRLPARLRLFRPCPGRHLTGRPTAPPSARSRPMAPPRTGPLRVPRLPMRRLGRCRRYLRRPRPGPGPTLLSRAPTRGPRGLRARLALRGRRGLRSPRPTSAAPGRPREARAAPPLRVPAHPAAQGGSAQAPPLVVPTRAARAARGLGRPRRGPRDLVRPGRVRPGQADPVRARGLHAPVRGRVTTRSVRPRPAWGRRLPLGPRVQRRLASPAVPVLRPAARVVPAVQGGQGVHVRPDAVQVGPACPTAARVPAGSLVRVPAAPGRAR